MGKDILPGLEVAGLGWDYTAFQDLGNIALAAGHAVVGLKSFADFSKVETEICKVIAGERSFDGSGKSASIMDKPLQDIMRTSGKVTGAVDGRTFFFDLDPQRLKCYVGGNPVPDKGSKGLTALFLAGVKVGKGKELGTVVHEVSYYRSFQRDLPVTIRRLCGSRTGQLLEAVEKRAAESAARASLAPTNDPVEALIRGVFSDAP